MTNAIFNQQGFRGREDVSGVTWIVAENADFSIADLNNFRLRVEVEVTNLKATANRDFNIYYARNEGSYVVCDATSTYLRPSVSSQFTDGDADDVDRLVTSTLPFAHGELDDDGVCGDPGANLDFNGEDHCEAEFCVAFQSGVGEGDTFDIEIRLDGGVSLNGYTRRPRITYSTGARRIFVTHG